MNGKRRKNIRGRRTRKNILSISTIACTSCTSNNGVLQVFTNVCRHLRCLQSFNTRFQQVIQQPKHYIKQHADLYGKTRVKRTTERAALCVYAVFVRISSKSADFTRVLPCKMTFTINCIFSRVLPVKSQQGCQNRPQDGPRNRTRIALNTRFVEVIRV